MALEFLHIREGVNNVERDMLAGEAQAVAAKAEFVAAAAFYGGLAATYGPLVTTVNNFATANPTNEAAQDAKARLDLLVSNFQAYKIVLDDVVAALGSV